MHLSLCVSPILILNLVQGQLYQYGKNFIGSRRSQYQQFFNRINYQRLKTTIMNRNPSILDQFSSQCGNRQNNYRPDQKARRGRIIWTDNDSQGARAAPEGSFPWLASLFLRQDSGDAYFLCAATILTHRVLVSAAHCFNSNYRDKDWFVRVGDNYILSRDPSEQIFQVSEIVKHSQFLPLSSPGGEGRNDIALLVIRTREGRGISFDKFVRPACLPARGTGIKRWEWSDCEITGWGMQEFDNTASYPDSVRASSIRVNNIPSGVWRNVESTGKFCAGGSVDACQEDSGGPLMCKGKGRYWLVGIISSGKGCGSYPGLYTDVSRYQGWISDMLQTLHNEI